MFFCCRGSFFPPPPPPPPPPLLLPHSFSFPLSSSSLRTQNTHGRTHVRLCSASGRRRRRWPQAHHSRTQIPCKGAPHTRNPPPLPKSFLARTLPPPFVHSMDTDAPAFGFAHHQRGGGEVGPKHTTSTLIPCKGAQHKRAHRRRRLGREELPKLHLLIANSERLEREGSGRVWVRGGCVHV